MSSRRIVLPTGLLELEEHESAFGLDALLGFGARANARRGFVFLSKVLGNHLPVKPSTMGAIHASLAAGIPPLAGPVVFIAMAESAIGLGQGVFEAWLQAHPGQPALFLHTSRYKIGQIPVLEFEQAYSHAPRQLLHVPTGQRELALFLEARSLVLVDDEASTGTTFLKLSEACRTLNAGIGQVHLATIANFMGAAAPGVLAQHFGVPVTIGAALTGAYRFTPGQRALATSPAQELAGAGGGASGRFGRLGLDGALSAPASLVGELAGDIGAGQSVLVLGTGEFMHPAYLLGAALEDLGIDVTMQSTTRSPVLTWGAVGQALRFPDVYGGAAPNFLYNVTPGQYEHVFICHETPPNDALYHLAAVLGARLFHFKDELQVVEVSEICAG